MKQRYDSIPRAVAKFILEEKKIVIFVEVLNLLHGLHRHFLVRTYLLDLAQPDSELPSRKQFDHEGRLNFLVTQA